MALLKLRTDTMFSPLPAFLDGASVEVMPRTAAKVASFRPLLPAGTQVRLTAVLDEEATFVGYAQQPMRTPKALRPYLGDPLATCLDFDVAAMARGEVRDVMECPGIMPTQIPRPHL